MELKISKISRESKSDAQDSNNKMKQSENEQLSQDTKRETITLENGVLAHKQGEHYFISVGGQELEVTEEEMLRVTARPDYVFDLIMEKRGKFWFNASIDNVGLNRETI